MAHMQASLVKYNNPVLVSTSEDKKGKKAAKADKASRKEEKSVSSTDERSSNSFSFRDRKRAKT